VTAFSSAISRNNLLKEKVIVNQEINSNRQAFTAADQKNERNSRNLWCATIHALSLTGLIALPGWLFGGLIKNVIIWYENGDTFKTPLGQWQEWEIRGYKGTGESLIIGFLIFSALTFLSALSADSADTDSETWSKSRSIVFALGWVVGLAFGGVMGWTVITLNPNVWFTGYIGGGLGYLAGLWSAK
jgi:hypothetical protein